MEVCPRCGGKLVQRHDDQPHLVKKRLELYHRQTQPLVKLFEQMGVLKKVDGERSPDEVFEDIKKIILSS